MMMRSHGPLLRRGSRPSLHFIPLRGLFGNCRILNNAAFQDHSEASFHSRIVADCWCYSSVNGFHITKSNEPVQMSGVPQSAEGVAKFLDVLRSIPVWLFLGLTLGTGLLLGVPGIARALPPSLRPWGLVISVISGSLAITQSISGIIRWYRQRNAALVARRRFHLNADIMQSRWSTAKQRDDSIITDVVVKLLVKNLTDRPVALARCRLIYPRVRGEVVFEDVSVRAVNHDVYGTAAQSGHFIPKHTSLPASVHIMIRGVPWPRPKKEVRVVIGVEDDEGHEQRIKLKVRVIPSADSIIKTQPLELVSGIPDLVDRQVAVVLQAELPRYEKNGRRVGGLGSIHLAMEGKLLTSATVDSWNPCIAENTEGIVLQSENVDALLAIYSRLSTDEERHRFASALLKRLDGNSGYLAISYFIVCALWKIGKLPEALAKAKESLPQGETRVFGLSNVLMLINMLLFYRSPDFDDDVLDNIERFLRGLNEHSFQIPEKIAAIRVTRLR